MLDILAITLLIALALVLIILEIFFLPGISIAGICSLLFYGGSIYYAYTLYGSTGATVTFAIAAIATGIAIYAFIRSRALHRMSLQTEVDSVVPTTIPADVQVGDTGTTLSRLNPMGKVLIGTHTLEARAENELIDENCPIKVIRIERTVIIVNKENLSY